MGAMRAVVVTISDSVSRGEREDRSGEVAESLLVGLGFEVERLAIPDGRQMVEGELRRLLADDPALILTTGGTGFGPRDLTPEGTTAVIQRPAPGLSEAMRAATFGDNPYGMLSRGVSGIAGGTLILNLPGSPRAVEESLEVVGPALGHAVRLARGEERGHPA